MFGYRFGIVDEHFAEIILAFFKIYIRSFEFPNLLIREVANEYALIHLRAMIRFIVTSSRCTENPRTYALDLIESAY